MIFVISVEQQAARRGFTPRLNKEYQSINLSLSLSLSLSLYFSESFLSSNLEPRSKIKSFASSRTFFVLLLAVGHIQTVHLFPPKMYCLAVVSKIFFIACNCRCNQLRFIIKSNAAKYTFKIMFYENRVKSHTRTLPSRALSAVLS